MSNDFPAEMLAAESGDSFAQFDVAVRYIRGDGVPQDFDKAREWLLRAANQGHARAKYNLGSMYLQGAGVQADPAEALRWFESAFEALDPHSLCELAILVEAEEDKLHAWPFALKCYRAAADAGNSKAQYVLGKRLLGGQGVEQNLELGSRYIVESAQRANPMAICLLAQMYEEGFGVEQSLPQAVYLFHVAALEGHPQAQSMGRELAARLSPDEQQAVLERISRETQRTELN
jgi:TPR repeat protein